MAGSLRLNLAVMVAEAVTGSFMIWFVGWLIYDLADVWVSLTNAEFQHLLLALMAVAVLTSLYLLKGKLSETNNRSSTKAKHRANNPQSDPRVSELEAEVKELKDKMADIHAFAGVRKKKRQG